MSILRIFKMVFAVFLLFVNFFAQAQSSNLPSGFIVTQNHDTLQGVFKYRRDMTEEFSFKMADDDKFKRYKPEEIKSFSFEGGFVYDSRLVPVDQNTNERYFLQRLVGGAINLFWNLDQYYVEDSEGKMYLLEQRDRSYGDNAVMKDKRYVRVLSALMVTCPELKNKIERTKLNVRSLVETVSAYNECADPSQEVLVTDEPSKINIQVGIKSGLAISRMNDIGLYFPGTSLQFQNVIGFVGGASLNISYKNRVSVQPELLVIQKGGTYSGIVSNLYERQVSFSMTSLQVPISVVYTLPTNILQPYVLAGGLISYTLSEDSYQSISGNKLIVTTNKEQYGFRFGGGLKFYPVSKLGFSLEYVFERSFTDPEGLQQEYFEFNTSSITLGILF